jgi:hypothetical protein
MHEGPAALRVGVDVVATGRVGAVVGRHGEAFAARTFHPRERARTGSGRYDRSFAAKEALLKALGTGDVAGIDVRDIDASDLCETGRSEPERAVRVSGPLALGLRLLGRRWRARAFDVDGHEVVVVWIG